MKTIFALCLVLAFVYAQSTFTPEWKSCEGSYGWLTQNVTLDAAPIAGKNSTFTFCGQNRNFYVIAFEEVHATSGTVLDLTFPVNASIAWKNTGCYDVNFQIPQGATKDLTIHFSATALALHQQGCVDVTLNLASTKFLAF